MINKFRIFSSIIVCLFISGCALNKPPPQVPIPDNARIGFMVLTDDQPRHFHVGIMRHQNFERTGVSEWGFKDALNSYALKRLDGVNNQKIILIEPTPALRSNGTKLLKPGWDTMLFNNALENHVRASIGDHDLDFIMVIEPVHGRIDYNTPVDTSNYGLYTRCTLIYGCSARELRHFTARVYALNPTRLAARIESSNSYIQMESAEIPISWPDEKRDISVEDIDKAKDRVLAHGFQLIDGISKSARFHSRPAH